jgi:two-component system LytT family response regulator
MKFFSQEPAIYDSINVPVEYRKPLERIVVKDRKKITIISVDNVYYLEAQDDYVEIYTGEGKWLKQQTMKYFESVLEPTKFVRIHRKYIINLSQISKLDKLGKESHIAVLKFGHTLPVSRSGYINLKQELKI